MELTKERMKKILIDSGMNPVKGWEACDSGGKTMFAHLHDEYLNQEKINKMEKFGVHINSYSVVVCEENKGHVVLTLDKEQDFLKEDEK